MDLKVRQLFDCEYKGNAFFRAKRIVLTFLAESFVITAELANFAGNNEINGNRGDISVDEAVVDADREEWRCARVGTYRDA